MTLKSKLFSAAALALLSSVASAHAGHDHSHWMSSPIHVLTLIAAGTIIGTLVSLKYAKTQKQIKTSNVEKD